MKKIVSLLLCFGMLFSLVSCGEEPVFTTVTSEVETEEKAPVSSEEEVTTAEKEIVYDQADEMLTPEKLAEIPIAKEGMTSDELRQICIDFTKLTVTFQWISNRDFTYRSQLSPDPVSFYEGKLWGGIPYIDGGSGNLYRLLNYYDTQTGVLDVSGFILNLKLLGTVCSSATSWGWARVINSATFGFTRSMNQSHGFIPVGPYTYDASIVDFGENGVTDCDDIAKENGEQVMYQSYAAAKKADALVNPGHVTMLEEDPVVKYNPDGTINGKESYVVQVEQGLFTRTEKHARKNSLGYDYRIQGSVGLVATFEELYKGSYLPHTFKEFHGNDPVEESKATVDLGASATVTQITQATLTANYVISDVFVVIKNADGEESFRYIKHAPTHYDTSMSLSEVVYSSVLQPYADGTSTLTISVQLSSGEVIEAYTGTILP